MRLKLATLLCAALFCLVPTAFSATNDLATALQKGLFEEEANHDLKAAVQAYQSVATQFDKDRKLAATAIFRLGECYRKQGHTNEAKAQYERVLREFSDQTPLVTLSRTYLAASGQAQTGPTVAPAPATSAEAEEVRRIQAMIKDSPDLINALTETGGMPLHAAAEKGQMVVAQFLLANGAEVNAQGLSGRTPLHLATQNGHKAMVELLLSHKADVQAADDSGSTPLHYAATKGFRSVLELLLAHQANVNAKAKTGGTPLHAAADSGFKAIAEVLLRRGAQVNAMDNAEMTALHLAARRGDQPLAELFLASKADVNAAGRFGATPLHLAAANGYLDVATLLLSHGAAVNAKTAWWQGKDGWTPLHMAINAKANREEMVDLLLKSKSDPNARIASGTTSSLGPGAPSGFVRDDTPLLMATAKNYPEMVELLLTFKADPNLQGENRRLPIFNALSSSFPTEDRKRMLTALLEHGAGPNAKNSEGWTPLFFAAQEGNKDLVELLLAYKADVNARERQGYSPLHIVVFSMGRIRNAAPLAELLLRAGADVNARSDSGVTPLKALAGERRSPDSGAAEMAELLRQHGALEQMPDFASVRLTRKGLEQPISVFRQDTNALNQFTLLEALGSYYANPQQYGVTAGFLPPPPVNVGGKLVSATGSGAFPFPDLSSLRIHRPLRDKPGQQKVIPIILAKGTNSIDCANDLRLEFGDVVEIPERVHALAEASVGLTYAQMQELKKCVQRKVTVTVPGDRTEVSLTGLDDAYLPGVLKRGEVQKILRSSSDFTRVRITRTEPGSSQPKSITQNVQVFWEGKEVSSNALWLRDGDVIEVPDKP